MIMLDVPRFFLIIFMLALALVVPSGTVRAQTAPGQEDSPYSSFPETSSPDPDESYDQFMARQLDPLCEQYADNPDVSFEDYAQLYEDAKQNAKTPQEFEAYSRLQKQMHGLAVYCATGDISAYLPSY